MNTALNWCVGIFLRPVKTIREIVAARPLKIGFVTLLVITLLSGLFSIGLGGSFDPESLSDEEVEITAAFTVVGTILFVAGVLIVGAVFTLVLHVIAKLFGGNGAYAGMLAALLMMSVLNIVQIVPQALALAVSAGDSNSAFGAIASLAGLVVAIWSIVLGVIVIRENYQMSTGLALLSGVISFAAAFIVGIIVAIVFAIVLVVGLLGISINT